MGSIHAGSQLLGQIQPVQLALGRPGLARQSIQRVSQVEQPDRLGDVALLFEAVGHPARVVQGPVVIDLVDQ